jgi:hypothetical protein
MVLARGREARSVADGLSKARTGIAGMDDLQEPEPLVLALARAAESEFQETGEWCQKG